MKLISTRIGEPGLIIKAKVKIHQETLYLALQEAGFQITTAEAERLALFSCDEIIKAADGSLFYHQDYMIRTLAESINLSIDRDREAEAIHGGKPLRGVFLPRITIEGD
jgi:hypothetical protein